MTIDNQNPEAKPSVQTPTAEQLSQIPTMDVPENASTLLGNTSEQAIDVLANGPDDIDSAESVSFVKAHWKKIVAGLAALGLAGGVTWAADNILNPAPEHQTTASGTPNPGTVPDILPSEAPVVEQGPKDSDWVNPSDEIVPASLDNQRNISRDEFAALTEDEQHAYLAWFTRDLTDYEAMYSFISGNEFDKLSADISIDSSDQDAYTYASYMLRLAFSAKGDDRYKLLIAALKGGASSNMYQGYKDDLDNSPEGLLPRTLAATGSLETNFVISSSGNVTDDQGQTYRDVVTRNVEGALVTNRLYYFTTQVDGKTYNGWVNQSRTTN